jgi:hypothetical protein
MAVRAKFKCDSKVLTEQGGSEVCRLNFSASHGDGKDNKDWSKWTPAGSLSMTISNPEAFGWFEQGAEYYLDFSKA